MKRGAYLLLCAYIITLVIVTARAQAAAVLSRHDRNVIRFFQHHPHAAATPAGGRILARLLPKVMAEYRSLQDARASPPPVAHEALWRCIAGYPGARPGGGSGESGGDPGASNGSHFNILQMTDPWEGIHPIGMSPEAIMEAAETSYRANGYSHSWLIEQWGQTISPCWGFA